MDDSAHVAIAQFFSSSRYTAPGSDFVAISGVANSPSHDQWEILYSRTHYSQPFQNSISDMRRVIDAVKAPTTTVTKKNLTITVQDLDHRVGTELAAGSFKVSYSGLAPGDSPTDLGGELLFRVVDQNGREWAREDLDNAPVGTYRITAEYRDDHEPEGYQLTFVAGELRIAKPSAIVSLSGLMPSWDGTAKSVTATTAPSGLDVSVYYSKIIAGPIANYLPDDGDGSNTDSWPDVNKSDFSTESETTTAPSELGYYLVRATVDDDDYEGTRCLILGILIDELTVTITDLVQVYDGTSRSVTVATEPPGLATVVTYDGAATEPTDVGEYEVQAAVDIVGFEGEAKGLFRITPAPAVVTLGKLTQHVNQLVPVTVTTVPPGVEVAVTYDGTAALPAAGLALISKSPPVRVAATVVDPNYTGSATGNLTVLKAFQSVVVNTNSYWERHTLEGQPIQVVLTAASKESPTAPITFELGPRDPVVPASDVGRATLEGNVLTVTEPGIIEIVAKQAGDSYWGAAQTAFKVKVLGKGVGLAITLQGLERVYDGNPQPVTWTTDPADQRNTVSVTYAREGETPRTTAPTEAGEYRVTATGTNPAWPGTAGAVLTIKRAPAIVSLNSDDLAQPFNRLTAPRHVTVPQAEGGSNLPVQLTYAVDGQTDTLENIATQGTTLVGKRIAVTAEITAANYTGSVTRSIVVGKGTQTVSVPNEDAYNPWATKLSAGVTAVYVSLMASASSGLPTISYELIGVTGSASLLNVVVLRVTQPGSYRVKAVQPGNAHWEPAEYEFTVRVVREDAMPTIRFDTVSLTQTYDGTAKSVTAITEPPNLQVKLTYDGNENPPVDAGLYQVTATFVDSRYTGTATGSLTIAKARVTVNLIAASLNQSINDLRAVRFTTDPAGLAGRVVVTYGGAAELPADEAASIGNHEVIASVVDDNYEGSARGTLTVVKAERVITVNNPSGYAPWPDPLKGAPLFIPLLVAAGPDAAAFAFLAPDAEPGDANAWVTMADHYASIEAGNILKVYVRGDFMIRASTAATDYWQAAEKVFIVTVTGDQDVPFAPVRLVLGNLTHVYDGTPKAASLTVEPAGLATTITYDGVSEAPVDAGSYEVVGAVDTEGFEASVTNRLTIAKAPASIRFDEATLTQSGTVAKAVGYTTVPATLAASVTVTYDGKAALPTGVGEYEVAATIIHSNYQGQATATLRLIGAARITLSDLNQTYDGSPRRAGVRTVPAGLQTKVTYNGSESLPVAAGTYAVRATIENEPNYSGEVQGQLVIAKATVNAIGFAAATLSQPLNELTPVVVTTDPAGLAVTVTYDGMTELPGKVGAASVVAVVADRNWTGRAEGILTVEKKTPRLQVIDPSSYAPWDVAMAGEPLTIPLLTRTEDSALQVVYSVATGEATVDNTQRPAVLTVTQPGTVVIVARTAATAEWQTDEIRFPVTVNGEGVSLTAAVTLGDLSQVYTGAPRLVSVITDPPGLTATVTYDGQSRAPRNAGRYAVAATVQDDTYSGSATGTLVVEPATAGLVLNSSTLKQMVDELRPVTATTFPRGLKVKITYDGSPTMPTEVGKYRVVATIDYDNWEKEVTGELVIFEVLPDLADLSLSGTSQVYSGNPRSVTVTTDPPGLAIQVTYDGSPQAPTDAGIYPVIVTVTEEGYAGAMSGILEIKKAQAGLSLNRATLAQTYNAVGPVTATTIPEGLRVKLTYDGSASLPANAGQYQVVVSVEDDNYEGEVAGVLVIGKANPVLEVLNLEELNPVPAMLRRQPLDVDLNVTTGSGLPLTFSVDAAGAEIQESTLVVSQPGIYRVTAHHEGDENWQTAATTFSVEVQGEGVPIPQLRLSVATLNQAGMTINVAGIPNRTVVILGRDDLFKGAFTAVTAVKLDAGGGGWTVLPTSGFARFFKAEYGADE